MIQKNIGAFYEVGRALMEIRDRGLYKDVLGFDTFEAYCRGRWDFSRRHAYRFIEAVEVIGHVSESDTKPRINLEQTRPLSKLEPDQQRQAYLYRQLEAAQVQKQICPNGQKIEIPESQLRPLTKLRDNPEKQREAWAKAVATAPDGMEIRDKGLYRDVLGYETFESYCKARWDMSKMHAYRLMDSCKVIDTVKSNQLVTPTNESQTRPLAKLEPELTMIDFIFIAVIAGAVAGIGLALLFNRLCEFTKRQPEK